MKHLTHRMPPLPLPVLGALLLLLTAIPATAEDWALGGIGQYPPEAQQNRIIKWCKEDSSQVRYASANLKLRGYHPCGTLETKATCDASGTRLLSKNEDRPKGHLDCSVGPRILIVNRGEPGPESEVSYHSDDGSITPLSATEEAELEKEAALAEEMQRKSMEKQIEMVRDALLKSFLGIQAAPNIPAKQRRLSNRDNRNAKKELEQILSTIDPQTRKQIEQLFADPNSKRRQQR